MRTLRAAKARRLAPLAVIALGATALALGVGVTRTAERTLGSPAAAWHGLVGAPRPPVAVGQRMLVVLNSPSLADRVAAAGGTASDAQERRWTAAAIASQQQLLTTLAAQGIRIHVEFHYARVLNGFSAALDAPAVSLLDRRPEVAGVYPVRAAYPASISSQRLVRQGLARGIAQRPGVLLPGYDGRGVTIALLDTGVDRTHPYLRGRILDGFNVLGDGDVAALAAAKPDDSRQVERHGTEMAGLLVGAGGPAGLAGVASGASVLPIRIAGWQRDLTGNWAVSSRTDQLIAGLERAVDPNQDGDAHDAARIALVGVAAAYAAFADSPEARAVDGATRLDTLVVAPVGNDGPGGPAYGSVSSPGGAPNALTVGAADLRSHTEQVRVVIRTGLHVVLDRLLPLAGAVVPEQARELPLATPARSGLPLTKPPSVVDFFDRSGVSRVSGRAALVPAGDDPAAA
ncbi:MAG: S8 family serine peptidase, partial [Gaiellaceae bacterium]